jgi:hypothetical protein
MKAKDGGYQAPSNSLQLSVTAALATPTDHSRRLESSSYTGFRPPNLIRITEFPTQYPEEFLQLYNVTFHYVLQKMDSLQCLYLKVSVVTKVSLLYCRRDSLQQVKEKSNDI